MFLQISRKYKDFKIFSPILRFRVAIAPCPPVATGTTQGPHHRGGGGQRGHVSPPFCGANSLKAAVKEEKALAPYFC